jgi:hypothetical protein
MPSENLVETAAARLRVAGLPDAVVNTLAARVAGILEQVHAQAAALPLAAEPATTFAVGQPRATSQPKSGEKVRQSP